MILDRIATFLDHVLNVIIVIVCLFMMLIGSYTFYDRLIHGELFNGGSLLTDRNEGYENQIGWIKIDGTNINYPVLQGKDNYEYLEKNPKGEIDTDGSIFLEWSNDRLLRDEFSIIYGQHPAPEKMFSTLGRFLERDFFDAHQNGTITVSDHKYSLKIFAAYKVETSNSFIYSPSLRTAESIINFIKTRAEIYKEPDDKNGRIVALSTCSKEKELFQVIVFGTISE